MRRPIASRDTNWAKKMARFLARMGVRPNLVSGMSVLFAALAALCLIGASRGLGRWNIALFCVAALCIQLRLLCNLFDGMLAVEFKQGSALGPLFNDFPDRPADVLILVGCGYCGNATGLFWMPLLGWIAASLALLTAYVRVLGVAVGAGEYFTGPMAKPHRMAMATVACLVSALEALFGLPPRFMALALLVIVLGCIVTVICRLKSIGHDLGQTAASRAEVEPTG